MLYMFACVVSSSDAHSFQRGKHEIRKSINMLVMFILNCSELLSWSIITGLYVTSTRSLMPPASQWFADGNIKQIFPGSHD